MLNLIASIIPLGLPLQTFYPWQGKLSVDDVVPTSKIKVKQFLNKKLESVSCLKILICSVQDRLSTSPVLTSESELLINAILKASILNQGH